MAPHRIATPPDTMEDDVTMGYTAQSMLSESYLYRPRPLLPGIYAPTPCFFQSDDDDVDIDAIAKHAVRLARAGLAGITTQGSNGEAVHLTQSERQLVTRTTRTALDNAGFSTLPIIVGCGAQSTREAISLCHDAAESGGDYVLVLPPSYYKASYPRSSLLAHFRAIAAASPLPMLIYNYPGAAAGLDLDSDFLLELAMHPNIIGTKLTCANVGKLGRVVTGTSSPSKYFTGSETDPDHVPQLLYTPKTTPTPSISEGSLDLECSASSSPSFIVLAGSADFLLPALSVGAHGGLVGLANIVPKSCVALYRAYGSGDMKRTRWLQATLAKADEVVQRMGVVGTKAVMQARFGYGGTARRPLPRPGEGVSAEDIRGWNMGFEEAMRIEKAL
ncbi:MAG: hypothetical protein LQ340_005263 [Diploschistes diacapsis]|nr:MAG: hypothetical protein LQ340_005263 [Diploschistes diacapsis]